MRGARPFDQPSRWPRRRARRLCGCPRAARAPIRVHSAASLGCASVQLTASRGRACARAQGQRARIRAPTTRSTRASSAAGRAGTTPGSDAGVPPGSRGVPLHAAGVPPVPLSAVLASDKCSARGVFSHRPAHPGSQTLAASAVDGALLLTSACDHLPTHLHVLCAGRLLRVGDLPDLRSSSDLFLRDPVSAPDHLGSKNNHLKKSTQPTLVHPQPTSTGPPKLT